jgi:hypothetical protein
MENSTENKKIEIEHEALKYLNTTRKWVMFLAVFGFIILGLIIVIGLIAGTFMSAFSEGKLNTVFSGPLIFGAVVLAAIVYFFPGLYLFRFSKHLARALESYDKLELHKAFKNLKSYFVYIGVLIILFMIVYVAALVITGTSMSFLKGLS